ncbi:MAG: hypothetical protein HMLKMBBP_02470 [Planctomycetes bacterium]|nr:hypothetical protein [Planctomycetota bacterium]
MIPGTAPSARHSTAPIPERASFAPPPPRPLSRGKKLCFAAATALLAYAAVEAAATTLWLRTVPQVYWIYEGSGPGVTFDAATGYRTYGGPSRVAKFSRGSGPRKAEVEYVGAVGGNSSGFADGDEFGPARTRPDALRLAVFGDSFTGGDLPRRWPDRAEDADPALDLLNLSQSGFGIGNWHRTLLRVVRGEGYEIDGAVFAVWDNDLARRFYVCDHGEGSVQRGGRVESWDPADYPATRADADRWMATWHGFVVDRERFDAAVAGAWTPRRPFRLFVAGELLDRALGRKKESSRVGAMPHGTLARDLADPSQGRGRLVREVAGALRELRAPAFVVKIPTLEELIEKRTAPPADDARAFAAALGAPFVDGALAFDGLDEAEIRSHWYERDLHWNQKGSDRFAEWFAPVLRDAFRGKEGTR